MEILCRDDLPALMALLDAALPGERLSADEVLSCCFEDPDPAVVLAAPGADGAVSVVVRPGDRPVAAVRMLAVVPAAQGLGLGRRLLEAAHEWAAASGAVAVTAGGGEPFCFWPGVDVSWTRALSLFESAGYEPDGGVLGLSCPTTFRRSPPAGVDVHRVLDDDEAAQLLDLVDSLWPAWRPSVARAVDHGSALAAVTVDDGVVGFACHSVNRTGVVGPIGVRSAVRRTGIGATLVSAACYDLRAAGLPDAHFWTTDSVAFLARATGASVARVYRTARWRSRNSR